MRVINSIKNRRDSEEGFTLIELMVVVLIIAILIAIAIPTFLGARQRAQDSAAKSDLRNALAAAKVHYTDTETYVGMTNVELALIEPSLTYVGGAGTTAAVGYVVTASPESVCLAKASKSGKSFSLRESVATGTTFSKDGTCTLAGGW